jgi:hypothetical protein
MAEKTKKTPVRLLVDQDINGKNYKCNQVVILDADQAAALVEQGIADSSKAAVEYALKQGADPVEIFGSSDADQASDDPA